MYTSQLVEKENWIIKIINPKENKKQKQVGQIKSIKQGNRYKQKYDSNYNKSKHIKCCK